MKKILLATALAAVSLSSVDANWSGFYVRGGLAGIGFGNSINDSNSNAQNGDGFTMFLTPEVSAGWGTVIADSVYLGVDGQIVNFLIGYKSSTTSSGSSSTPSNTTAYWTPNVQARVGLPLKMAMPYIAGGLGYSKLASNQDNQMLNGNNLFVDDRGTWSLRVGSEFKVSCNMFAGIYGQFTRTFSKTDSTTNNTTSQSYTVVGADMGWKF